MAGLLPATGDATSFGLGVETVGANVGCTGAAEAAGAVCAGMADGFGSDCGAAGRAVPAVWLIGVG